MAKEILTAGALLAAIGNGSVTRITEAQASTMVPDHFEVNTGDVTKEGAAVRLTEAGKAALAPSKAAISIDDDVPVPSKRERRQANPRETIYPFEALAVGQSFHVPASAENPKPALRLSSSVSAIHLKFSPVLTDENGAPITEEVSRPVYARNEDGKGFAKDENGKRILEGHEMVTREKRGEPTRKFVIAVVDESDKRGAGARVFRTA